MLTVSFEELLKRAHVHIKIYPTRTSGTRLLKYVYWKHRGAWLSVEDVSNINFICTRVATPPSCVQDITYMNPSDETKLSVSSLTNPRSPFTDCCKARWLTFYVQVWSETSNGNHIRRKCTTAFHDCMPMYVALYRTFLKQLFPLKENGVDDTIIWSIVLHQQQKHSPFWVRCCLT